MNKMAKIAALAALALTCVASTACADFSADKSITVISREEGSGTRGAFVELTGVEQKIDGNKVDMTTDDAQITNNTAAMLMTVAGDAQAIGYVSLGSLNETVKAVKIEARRPARARGARRAGGRAKRPRRAPPRTAPPSPPRRGASSGHF